jgi:hypothetical protein
MWAHVAKDYGFAYVPEFLAEYREHKKFYYVSKVIKLGKILKILKSYNDYNWLSPNGDQRKMLKVAKKNLFIGCWMKL